MLFGTDGLLPSISLISQVQCRRSTHDIIHHDHSARPLGMMPWIIDFGSQGIQQSDWDHSKLSYAPVVRTGPQFSNLHAGIAMPC